MRNKHLWQLGHYTRLVESTLWEGLVVEFFIGNYQIFMEMSAVCGSLNGEIILTQSNMHSQSQKL